MEVDGTHANREVGEDLAEFLRPLADGVLCLYTRMECNAQDKPDKAGTAFPDNKAPRNTTSL